MLGNPEGIVTQLFCSLRQVQNIGKISRDAFNSRPVVEDAKNPKSHLIRVCLFRWVSLQFDDQLSRAHILKGIRHLQFQPLRNTTAAHLLLCPQIGIICDLDRVRFWGNRKRFLGIEIDRYKFEPCIFPPVLDTVLPDSGLGAVLQPLGI
jgi:hypothetical protein